MGSFRERVTRFMYGRYGADQLSKAMTYVTLILLLITIFKPNIILFTIAFIMLVYNYYRMFSRNISRRHSENEAYLKVKYKIIGRFNNFKLRLKDKKTHKIFKCPSCSQKIRVPKGKGKIMIKCPKCRIEFTRKS